MLVSSVGFYDHYLPNLANLKNNQYLTATFFVCINNYMKKESLKRDWLKKDKLTRAWLKDNGLREKQFVKVDLLFVKAEQIAHNLLKHDAALLNPAQTTTLQKYLNKAKQKTVTNKQAYTVMKIGKQINRQLFKAFKATNSR